LKKEIVEKGMLEIE